MNPSNSLFSIETTMKIVGRRRGNYPKSFQQINNVTSQRQPKEQQQEWNKRREKLWK
jgi:hypothetical protein